MNKKNIIKYFLLGTIFVASNIFADDKIAPNNLDSSNQIQKVVDEYKSYVSSISSALREEIIGYRKKSAEINKQKRELYASLTQEAQDYLSKTQGFKKRLPIRQRGLINIENPGQIFSPQKDELNNSPTK